MPHIPDDELLAAAGGGDKDAFEQLVLRYRAQAVGFASSMVGTADAEDAAQEAFAKLWLRAGSYRPGTSFKSWLFAILRNTCIDHIRKQKSTLPLELAAELSLPNYPQEELARAEEWRALRLGWDTLNEAARTALYLFAYEGMSYTEIGAALGRSPTQVKMTIYRARKKLRKGIPP